MGQVTFKKIGEPEIQKAPLTFQKIGEPEDNTVQMPDANKALKSGLGDIWNWGTTSVTGIHEPTMEDWQKDPKRSAWRSGVAGMTTPFSIAGELVGGVGIVGKKLGMFGEAAENASRMSKAARNVEEIPKVDLPETKTVYHGTRTHIETFDTGKNQAHGYFPNHIRFTENPDYADFYSLGESGGRKRDISALKGNSPNTIAANISTKNTLDLTKPIPPDQLSKLQELFPELKGNPTNDFIFDNIARSNKDLPFDAIRYNEHGQVNWAVPKGKNIETPWGVKLSGEEIPNNPLKPNKLKVKLNSDGTYTNMETGEVLPVKKGKLPNKFKITLANSGELPPPTLPKDLQGAKPRYNIRDKSYSPKFESDIDRAAYITAQTNPSKRDADYLKFVMDNTGLDEKGARALGNEVKAKFKETLKNHILKGGEEGDVPFSTHWRKKPLSFEEGLTKKTNKDLMDTMSSLTDDEIKNLDSGDEFGKGKPKENKPHDFDVKLTPEHDATYKAYTDELEKPINVNSGEMPNVKGPEKAETPPEFKVQLGSPPNIPPENQLPLGGGGDDEFGKGKPPDIPKDFSWSDWWQNRSRKDKATDVIFGASKSLQSSFDLSWPLRQGRRIIDTKAWRSGVREGIKAFADEKNYKSAMDAMRADPLFKVAEESGVDFTDLASNPKKVADLAKREEQFQSPLAENIPGLGKFVRASGRAYTTMGNKARFEYWKAITRDPSVNKKAAAEVVNTLTGRAKLPTKSLEKAAPAMNYVLYSPKAIYSNVKMLNPYTYYRAAKDGVVKPYLRSALQMVGTTYAVNQIAQAAGAKVTWDPTSSDFGKIRFGNTHLDLMGGVQQPLVLLARIAKQSKTSVSGKKQPMGNQFGQENSWDAITDFARSKLSPAVGAGVNVLAGADPVGNQTNLLKETGKMYSPLIAQDFYEIAQDNPELAPIITTLVGLGANQQTYRVRGGKSKMFGNFGVKMPKVKF